MKEQNRLLKWALLIVPLVAAGFAIYPPEDRLKGGIDLVGGTSLLYEIDTTGLKRDETSGLAEKVTNILKRRVDPNGQLNLVWRPIGNTRLEIQMPRPPKEVQQRRRAYNAALAEVKAKNISRIDVELALNAPAGDWEALVEELTRGVAERESKLEALRKAHEEYKRARGLVDADLSVEEEAEQAYDAALAEVERTALPPGRIEDVLGLQDAKEREKEISGLKGLYPSYAALID